MNKKLLTLSALVISVQAWAQDSTHTQQLDQVVITANKTLQKQSTTGKVITVISKEQIEKSSGRTVGQLLNQQAGVTINGALNNLGTNQALYVRGGSSGRTLVLLDGVPVYDPALGNSEFDLNLLSLNDVERIEICRGAQSTLYGSDAVAGVVNIITVKRDVNKPFNVKAAISSGSYGTAKGNLQVFGKAGKLTYTARYSHIRSDGFSAATDTASKIPFDNDSYKGNVANAAVQYQLTPELAVRSFVQYSGYKTGIDAGVFADEKDYTLKNKSITTGGGFTFRKTGISVTGNYQYSDNTRNYVNDSADVPGFTKYSTDNYFGRAQFAELYASISLGHGFSLLQGADYRFSSMNSQYYSLSPGPTGPYNPFIAAFSDTTHSQASLYGSLVYNAPNEKLNVELGGRLNVHSRYGSNYTYTFNPSYNINEHFRLFGSIATAFKAPSLYQLFSAYGKSDLKPERSTNYEGGIQQQHGMVSNRVVYFHGIIKDGLDFNNIDYQYFNFNKQTVTGIEWEGSIQPVKALTITFNYTYLHSKEKTQSRETYTDTTYSYLLRRPKHNVNLTAGYQFANGLFISASAKYVSKRADVGGYMVPDVMLDDYIIAGAYAEFKLKKYIKLFADAQNITNKQFFDVRGFNSIPLMVNGGVIFNW